MKLEFANMDIIRVLFCCAVLCIVVVLMLLFTL